MSTKKSFHAFLGILFCLLPVASAQYGGGTGQRDAPYLIYTSQQLDEIGRHEEDWDRHFMLMTNLDLSGYAGGQFNTIDRFTGVFNGNGHTISTFSCVCVGRTYVGLFEQLADHEAEIKNIVLIDASVHGDGSDHVGALVGYLGKGTVTDCHVINADVFAGRAVGGLVGSNANGVITNCSATGNVRGNECVGGLVGMNRGDLIARCCASGSVTGCSDVGGLVGTSYRTITNCYADCQVTGTDDAGGLVGHHGLVARCGSLEVSMPGTISCCYSLGRVSGLTAIGGLVGANCCGDIADSFWNIETSGLPNVCGTQGRDNSFSQNGGGTITSEMQTLGTYLGAGWDFIGETENGTEDIWWIDEGQDYPRLSWELTG